MKKRHLILLAIPLLFLHPLQSQNFEQNREHQDKHSWDLNDSSMIKTRTGMLVNAFFITVGVIIAALVFPQDPPDDITSSEKPADPNGGGDSGGSFPM